MMRQRVEEAVELAVVVLVAIGVGVLGALALLLVVGLESYGVELTRGYGGDPWVDVLEELADAVAYAACSDDRWLKEFLLSVLCDVVWARGR